MTALVSLQRPRVTGRDSRPDAARRGSPSGRARTRCARGKRAPCDLRASTGRRFGGGASTGRLRTFRRRGGGVCRHRRQSPCYLASVSSRCDDVRVILFAFPPPHLRCPGGIATKEPLSSFGAPRRHRMAAAVVAPEPGCCIVLMARETSGASGCRSPDDHGRARGQPQLCRFASCSHHGSRCHVQAG